MPPGYAGNVIENYQVFEMDQYLRATAEENDSGDFLFLENSQVLLKMKENK